MEEVEVPQEAENILLGLSDSGTPVEVNQVREFYKGKAQNGNKLVGQMDGYQIKYDETDDKFYIVT